MIYLVIEQDRIREISEAKSKEIKQWHYEGWDLSGEEIKVQNLDFKKISPLVEVLLKRKRPIPLWIWIVGGIGVFFLSVLAFAIFSGKSGENKENPITGTGIAMIKPISPIETLPIQRTQPTDQLNKEREQKANESIRKDLEIEKISQQKQENLKNLDFQFLQKNFDYMKRDLDDSVRELETCKKKLETSETVKSESLLKYDTIRNFLIKTCQKMEKEEPWCDRFSNF